MKKTIYKILYWIGIGIEFLLVIQTYAFLKMGEYIGMLVTAFLAATPVIAMIIHSKLESKRANDAAEKRKEFLRSKGVALKVDLSECCINENKNTVYYDRQDIPAYSLQDRLYPPRSLNEPDIPFQTLDSQRSNAGKALSDPERMYERFSYDRCVCTVKATLTYKGRKKTFVSEPVFMDKSSLGVYLAMYKEGFIYVNPQNNKDYFFDLDFLKQEG